MRIYNIKDKPGFIHIVAHWFNNEWGHLNPNRTYEDIIYFINGTIKDREDIIFICIDNEEILSTISYRKKEIKSINDNSPWLSSLVVAPNKRKQGIGRKTIELFEGYCKSINKPSILLFTEDQHNWYMKQGWMNIQEHEFKGHSGMVMKKILTSGSF